MKRFSTFLAIGLVASFLASALIGCGDSAPASNDPVNAKSNPNDGHTGKPSVGGASGGNAVGATEAK